MKETYEAFLTKERENGIWTTTFIYSEYKFA